MKKIPCPTCQELVDLTEKTAYRPFCSERCRLIDLGAWASEEYQISGKSPIDSTGDLDVSTDELTDWENPTKIH